MMLEVAEPDSIGWSLSEQEIARKAFDLAYRREIDVLINSLRQRVQTISSVDEVWELHDHLSTKRYEIDGKYDYRYNNMLFVFASLVKDGLLSIEELSGLDAQKLAKVKAMARM